MDDTSCNQRGICICASSTLSSASLNLCCSSKEPEKLKIPLIGANLLHGRSACAKIGRVAAGHLAQGSSTSFSSVAKSSQASPLQALQRSASLRLGTSAALVGALQRPHRIFKLGQEVKLPTRQGLSTFEIYRPVSHKRIAAVQSISVDKHAAAAALPRSDIHRSRGMPQGDRLKRGVASATERGPGVHVPLSRLLDSACCQSVRGGVRFGGQVI